MTSLGRGRAWSQNKSGELPRPGRSLSMADVDCSKIINKINLISNNESLEQRVCEIGTLITIAGGKDNLKSVVNELHNRALQDTGFGHKLVSIIADQSIRQICDTDGNSVKRHIILSLQNDYIRRKELREENLMQFRNAVRFHCEVFRRIKIRDKVPISVFERPLLNYLEMLLETASLDDIMIFAAQIIMHGQYLSSKYEEEFGQLMINARETLIKRPVPPDSRKLLLYAIDLVNEKFGPFPSHVQKFYDSQLGPNFKHQQHDELTYNMTVKTQNEETTRTESFEPARMESNEPIRTESFETVKTDAFEAAKTESFERKNYPTSSNNRTLRAIRGSGGADVAEKYKDQEKSHFTKSIAPKLSCENKGWGHDDRFTKDYD